MCGIAGIFHRGGEPVDEAVLRSMTRAIAHRGPDGEGFWVDGSIGLGHRRLAIRDLTDAGRQPMADPTGRIVVTYNGEIYNDAALRRELERDHGARFRSTCDAEVIPAGYVAWGERLFDRLEGMFAIALWDRERQELVLARDGAGIKPVYVWTTPDRVVFGSEVKALLQAPFVPRTIDPDALHSFLAQGYVSPTRSLLRDVAQVAPGTVRVIGRGGTRERRFWRPRRQPVRTDLREAVDEFLTRWHVVVNDMLVSDVPVGVLQSGGVDSSLIAAQLGRDGVKVPLFTGGFPGLSHDETAMARRVAPFAGMPHHAVPIKEEADAERVFRAVVRHVDGQLADSSAYAVFQLTREVRRHVPVVMGGDGADEFFGGYPTYRATRIASKLERVVPKALATLAGRRALASIRTDESRLPMMEVLARFCLGLGAAAQPHPQWRRLLYGHLIDDIYGPALRPLRDVDPLAAYGEAGAEGNPLDRCLLADQQFYLPADMLMKVDAMSMAHGLEVRVPFLDRRIMDLAGELDPSLLTPLRGPDKRVLREALRRLAPPEVVPSRKRGFNTPVASLLRGGLRGLGDRLFGRDAERLGPFFDAGAVRRLWESHRERRANHGYALWCLLTLAVWLESLDTTATDPSHTTTLATVAH